MTLTTLSPKRERLLLWLLAFTQFTVIMDFHGDDALAPQLMRAFGVGTGAVSGAISAYAWCAGLSGLFAATYIDRFDRKRLPCWWCSACSRCPTWPARWRRPSRCWCCVARLRRPERGIMARS